MRLHAISLVAAVLFTVGCQSSESQLPSASQPSSPVLIALGQAVTCGSPVPPALHNINVKVHLVGSSRLLAAVPLVGPDAAYCAQLGFADGRTLCVVRLDGSADREACEELTWQRLNDKPTWRRNGIACSGPTAGCEVVPDNPYEAVAFEAGMYSVCVGTVCGQVLVE